MSNRLAAIVMVGVISTAGAIVASSSLRGTLPSNWKELRNWVEPKFRGSALAPGQERRLRDLVDTFALDANRRLLEAAGWPEAAARFTPGLRREALGALVDELNADPSNGAEAMMRAVEATARAREAEYKLPPIKTATGASQRGSWVGGWIGVDVDGTSRRAAEQYARLLEAEGAWAALDEAMSRPRCVALAPLRGGWWRTGEFFDEGPAQTNLHILGQATLASMRLRCVEGHPESAAVWLRRCGAIARFFRLYGRSFSGEMRAYLLEWAAAHQVMALAAEGMLPSAQLRESIEALEGLRPRPRDTDELQLRSAFGILNSLQCRLTEPDEETATSVRYSRHLARLIEREELLVFREMAERVPDWREIRGLREALLQSDPWLRPRDLGRWADAARVVLAIELHRAEHGGQLPATLSELVPSILKELPPEPVGAPVRAAGSAPGPNGDWGYRVLAEPDQFGRRYLLYSFGPDRTDDGGRMADAFDGDGLYEPSSKYTKERREPDHVFNRPRQVPRNE